MWLHAVNRIIPISVGIEEEKKFPAEEYDPSEAAFRFRDGRRADTEGSVSLQRQLEKVEELSGIP